jgi:hypothetical protein
LRGADLTGEVGSYARPRKKDLSTGPVWIDRSESLQKEFDEIVAFVEVENLLDMPVKRCSSICGSHLQ